jgi:hypothetical protein
MEARSNTKVTVFTNQFVLSHGKQPRGFGSWAFNIHGEEFWHTGTFSEACAAAKAFARSMARGRRYLCIDVMP